MKTQKLIFFGLIILAFSACTKTETSGSSDPTLILTDPVQDAKLYSGNNIPIAGLASDDVELSSLVVNVKGSSNVNSFNFNQSFSLSGKQANATPEIKIPEDAEVGKYTLSVYCQDKEGNKSLTVEKTININDSIKPKIVKVNGIKVPLKDTLILTASTNPKGLLNTVTVKKSNGDLLATITDNLGIGKVSLTMVENGKSIGPAFIDFLPTSSNLEFKLGTTYSPGNSNFLFLQIYDQFNNIRGTSIEAEN